MAADGFSGAAVGAGIFKLLPAGLGAGIMLAVDPPKTRGEMFARAFVAFAFSHLFADAAASIALGLIPGFNPAAAGHMRAVEGACGALGWFVAGGVAVLAKRFKRDPLKTVKQIRG